ncbi:MAG: TOBE domain-containing protein, partial [Candidatus Puniceispirillaceae bacterium]
HQNLGASMVYVTHDQIEAMTLATKIVVMKSGVVQQIGSPVEIYNRPANLFVADFMGSPAMNLIPAQVKKNRKGATFTIARDNAAPLVLHDENAASLPDNVVLGLRPEDIGDAALRKGNKLQISNCQVDVVEPAGADTYVLMALGGVEVTARLQAETAAQPGADMEFTFNMAKASYFDADTGERLN